MGAPSFQVEILDAFLPLAAGAQARRATPSCPDKFLTAYNDKEFAAGFPHRCEPFPRRDLDFVDEPGDLLEFLSRKPREQWHILQHGDDV